jgi:hypothetical protein
MSSTLNWKRAISMGFSPDRRKRKRQHRKSARFLLTNGGFFNSYSAPGSTFFEVAAWHLKQARFL